MNTTKRILLTVVALALVLAAVVGMVACTNKLVNPVQMKETEIVIPLDSAVMADVSGKHLVDYLNVLQEKEFLTYDAPSGFVVTINDRTADSTKGEYWLIYTDDEENSDATWGTYEVEGKTYNSAKFGINDLPLKEGKTYVFMISKF